MTEEEVRDGLLAALDVLDPGLADEDNEAILHDAFRAGGPSGPMKDMLQAFHRGITQTEPYGKNRWT